MAERRFTLYAAAYAARDEAELDFDIVKRLFSGGAIAIFDATLFDTNPAGGTRIVNTLAGLFYPPCLRRDPAAEADDSESARLWHGLSDDNLNTLSKLFAQGKAWLVVIADAPLRQVLKDPLRTVVGEFEGTLTADDSSWNVGSRPHGMR